MAIHSPAKLKANKVSEFLCASYQSGVAEYVEEPHFQLIYNLFLPPQKWYVPHSIAIVITKELTHARYASS
jgi:hypothetical protein